MTCERPKPNSLYFPDYKAGIYQQYIRAFDVDDKLGFRWRDVRMRVQSDILPHYFSKSVPIDLRYQLVIGGITNDAKPNLLDPTDDSLEQSDLAEEQLFLVARSEQNISLIEEKMKIKHYRKHAACVVLDKQYLYMIGGEVKGEWVSKCTKVDILGLAMDPSKP